MTSLLPAATPARVAFLYAMVAAGWIVATDSLALWGGRELDAAWALNVGKGLLFVVVTGASLFALLRHEERRRATLAQAVEGSERRWRAALENAGHGVWDCDLTTGRAFFSREWKRMLGYSDQEVGDGLEEWESRLHPADREETLAVLRAHLEGQAPGYESVHRLRTRDGSYRWIRASGRVTDRDPDGRPLRVVGTHTDLTLAKASADRLADELAYSQAIFDHAPVGIISYRADGQALTANPAAAAMVGTTEEKLRRQNFRSIASWRESGLLVLAEQALATGQSTQQELRLQTTFGKNLWISAQFVPFRHHEEPRVVLLMRDVSERRRAMERLKLLEAALEAAPVGVAITDVDGVIEWTNPGFSQITGYASAEVRGRNPRILRSGRHGPEFYRGMWETILAGKVWSGEIQNARKDGAIYPERMTIAPVRGEGGKIGHFVAIKEDISERKLLEQQVARTQRLESIGLLASGIAHDLNNIFAPILLSLEILKVKYPQADGRKMLELIESAGQRGAGIVKQVLMFARGMDGERTELELRYLLKDLAQMLRETLPRQIQVELQVPKDLPRVIGDPTQLHQVFLNLAINARDAMPTGGRLSLVAREVLIDEAGAARHPELRPGPHLAVDVTDTGSGIPPQVLEHMFEPFYSTKPRGQGTGLGLSTVYGIVRSHGGAIGVETKIGAGTTFTIFLPAAARRPSASTHSNPPHDGGFRGDGRRILVVDDEESIRLITLHALQRHGFVVETAVDGVEALEIFRSGPGRYSAVVTDLMMPRMNGRELAREIRRLDPAVPILTCSGLSDDPAPGARLDAEDAELKSLLRKPFTEAELLGALQRALGPGEEKKG